MLHFTEPDTTPAALNRHESLLNYLQQPLERPDVIDRAAREAMSQNARDDYDRARIDYLSGGIVLRTTALHQGQLLLTRAFQENRARNSGHAGVMLTGPSTLGKTTSAKRLMRWVLDSYTTRFPEWRRFDHIPVAYVEVPAGSTGKTLLKEFAGYLGLSVQNRESTSDIRTKVVAALRRAHTQLIVVDELHNLAGRSAGLGEAVDILKGLHNDLAATFLYAGIDVTTSSLMSGARGQQLAGRFSVLELERYQWANTEHRREWKALIRGFETELLLTDQPPRSLDSLAEYLHQRTGGGIGALGRLLTGTAIDTITNAQGPERFQKEDLDGYRLDYTSETHFKNVLAKQSKRTRTATQEIQF